MRAPGSEPAPSLIDTMEADAARRPASPTPAARPAVASWKFPKPAPLDWGFTGDFIRSGRKWPLERPLLPQQERALEEADLKRGHCFFIDAGGGKTGVCIAEASHLWSEGKIDGMVVVAPLGPHQQWATEQFPTLCSIPWRAAYTGMPSREFDRFMLAKAEQMPVLVLHYDMLRTPKARPIMEAFVARWPRYYLAIDESSRIKTHSAERTKAVFILSRNATYRRALTGTPLLNGLENLWSQYHAVQEGVTGFRLFTDYRRYYCILKPIPGARSAHAQMIVGYRNQADLISRVRPYTTRIEAREFKKGPDPMFMRISVPMGARQQAAYAEMKGSLRAAVDGGTVVAENVLTMLGKLHQIAQGFIHTETDVAHLSSGKIEAMDDLLDSLDEPLIIFAPFRAQVAAAAEAIRKRNDRPVFIYEGRSDVEAWKDSGGVIIGNQASGLGIGQNLQNAAATIYLANSRSPEARIQSLARTDRTGQTRQVRYWDIVSPNTVDETILTSLRDGQDFAENFMRMVRAGEFRRAMGGI